MDKENCRFYSAAQVALAELRLCSALSFSVIRVPARRCATRFTRLFIEEYITQVLLDVMVRKQGGTL
ncbi:MAG: hypothetical protein NHB15_04475 [Methanosarcina barkeri]|nr:hypothetical protein [Methanosarcina sp. ERenArc_MAG2]